MAQPDLAGGKNPFKSSRDSNVQNPSPDSGHLELSPVADQPSTPEISCKAVSKAAPPALKKTQYEIFKRVKSVFVAKRPPATDFNMISQFFGPRKGVAAPTPNSSDTRPHSLTMDEPKKAESVKEVWERPIRRVKSEKLIRVWDDGLPGCDANESFELAEPQRPKLLEELNLSVKACLSEELFAPEIDRNTTPCFQVLQDQGEFSVLRNAPQISDQMQIVRYMYNCSSRQVPSNSPKNSKESKESKKRTQAKAAAPVQPNPSGRRAPPSETTAPTQPKKEQARNPGEPKTKKISTEVAAPSPPPKPKPVPVKEKEAKDASLTQTKPAEAAKTSQNMGKGTSSSEEKVDSTEVHYKPRTKGKWDSVDFQLTIQMKPNDNPAGMKSKFGVPGFLLGKLEKSEIGAAATPQQTPPAGPANKPPIWENLAMVVPQVTLVDSHKYPKKQLSRVLFDFSIFCAASSASRVRRMAVQSAAPQTTRRPATFLMITCPFSGVLQPKHKQNRQAELEEQILEMTAAELSGLLDFVRTFFGILQNVPPMPPVTDEDSHIPGVLAVLKKHNFSSPKHYVQFNGVIKNYILRKSNAKDLAFPEAGEFLAGQAGYYRPSSSSNSRGVLRQGRENNPNNFEGRDRRGEQPSDYDNSIQDLDQGQDEERHFRREQIKRVFKSSNFKKNHPVPGVPGPEGSRIAECLSMSKADSSRHLLGQSGAGSRKILPAIRFKRQKSTNNSAQKEHPSQPSWDPRKETQKMFHPSTRVKSRNHLHEISNQLQKICKVGQPNGETSCLDFVLRNCLPGTHLRVVGRNVVRNESEVLVRKPHATHRVDLSKLKVNSEAIGIGRHELKSGRKESPPAVHARSESKPVDLEEEFKNLAIGVDADFAERVSSHLEHFINLFERVVCKIPSRMDSQINVLAENFVERHSECAPTCMHFVELVDSVRMCVSDSLPLIVNSKSAIYRDAISARFGDGATVSFGQSPGRGQS
jgi:hypothetical protein